MELQHTIISYLHIVSNVETKDKLKIRGFRYMLMDHTLPQHYLTDDIYPELPRTYFNVNKQLGSKIKKHYALNAK